MKDSELRGYILKWYYDRRREDFVLPPKAADLEVQVTEDDIIQVCGQLYEQKFLKRDRSGIYGITTQHHHIYKHEINAFGIDIVEGNLTPAIKVEFVQHNNNTVTITDSTGVNNIIGSNNTLTLSGLAEAIESADATQQDKEEAKTLLRKFLEHPLVSAIAGPAVSLLGS